jgi:uncharacterized protein YfaT (DUF1175 family)
MKFLLPVLIVLASLPHCAARGKSSLSSSMLAFPADGTSGGVVNCELKGPVSSLHGPEGDADSIVVTAREEEGGILRIFFKSSGTAGRVRFYTDDGANLNLTFYKSSYDSDGDGFPDCAELVTEGDRAAFRAWFVRIAESQFLKKNPSWNRNERDCAGLIRYAYREALKKHDDRWLSRSGIVVDKNLPDVKRFNYPDVPALGGRIFKIKKGSADDVSCFGAFADAGVLLQYDTVFVSRRITDARPGDILFFHLESAESPYHSMIICEVKDDPVVVYHTGRDDVVKRVPLSYLKDSGPFEIEESNTRFLGIYRFKILE